MKRLVANVAIATCPTLLGARGFLCEIFSFFARVHIRIYMSKANSQKRVLHFTHDTGTNFVESKFAHNLRETYNLLQSLLNVALEQLISF